MRRALFAAFASLALLAPATASATDVQACLNASEKGQRSRAAGKLRDAREQFLICGAEGCPALVRKDCAQWQTDLAAALPTVVFGAKDKQGRDLFDVMVSMDGEVLLKKLDGKSVTVDPGPHTFRFEVAGAAPITERALVKEGERSRVIGVVFHEGGDGAAAEPTPLPATADRGSSGSGHSVLPWIVTGVGAAALVGGIVWLATAPSLPAGCDSSTTRCVRFASDTDASFRARQEEAGRSDGQPIEGGIIMGIGGALVVGGLVWYILDSSSSPSRTGVLRPAPWTTATGAGMSLGGSF